ncbi:MAG: glycosyltransferase family 4 protein [Planctomycetes bacterium]|nr:glycosyltransferase family 4 protein [Planctomycetota bacterium]MCB9903363.1 glycosyltransferase family 4 protein [Planctomycetota bacterium]
MENVGRGAGSRLRVAFLIDRWQPSRGGAESALAGFAAHLELRGHEVHAIGERGPLATEPAPGHFHAVQPSGLTRGARERSLGERMLQAADELGAQVTIGVRHLPRVDLYWPHGGSHAETLRLADKPARGRHRVFLELERQVVTQGARKVICVSETVREEFARHYPESANRLVVVPNGVDLDRHHPRLRRRAREKLFAKCAFRDDAPLISFVGRNAELKGLDILLESLVPLLERRWRLVVAGPRELAPWRAYALRLGLGADRVAMFEELDGRDLAAGSDLLVLPSRRDPCPLVVLEALAAGTPVLVSDRVGSRDAIRTIAAGEVVAPLEERPAWTGALRGRLARLHEKPTDHEVVRACVRERSTEKWWMRLEQLVVETAECRDRLHQSS